MNTSLDEPAYIDYSHHMAKKEILQQFLECSDSGVMCKIVDRATKDEDGDFVWVFANVYRNSR